MTMKQWSEALNISYGVLQKRVRQGKAEQYIEGYLHESR